MATKSVSVCGGEGNRPEKLTRHAPHRILERRDHPRRAGKCLIARPDPNFRVVADPHSSNAFPL